MRSLIHSRSERARSVGALALVMLLVVPGLAQAAGTGPGDAETRARQYFAEGTVAYDLGEFQKALQAYSEAYRLAPRPALLFNVAQCHRQLGQYERAAFFYRRYLHLAGQDAADAGLARELLAEVETQASRKNERLASAPRASDAPVQARPESRPLEKARPRAPEAVRAEGKPAQKRDAPVASRAPEKKADKRTQAQDDERIAGMLQPASEPAPGVKQEREPLTRKWWLWAGVGAAALLTGGIIYAASTPGARPTTLGTVPGR
jgi:tetratricopeptide (TPR) repeat protein